MDKPSSNSSRSYTEVVRVVCSHMKFASTETEKLSSIHSGYWIRKEDEMLNLNLESGLVATRLMAHHSWPEIKASIEKLLSIFNLDQSFYG